MNFTPEFNFKIFTQVVGQYLEPYVKTYWANVDVAFIEVYSQHITFSA